MTFFNILLVIFLLDECNNVLTRICLLYRMKEKARIHSHMS